MSDIIAFDALEYLNELKSAGMKEDVAEAVTKATIKAFTQFVDAKDIATKNDIQILRKESSDNKLELMKFVSENNWKLISTLVTFQTLSLSLYGFIQHSLG